MTMPAMVTQTGASETGKDTAGREALRLTSTPTPTDAEMPTPGKPILVVGRIAGTESDKLGTDKLGKGETVIVGKPEMIFVKVGNPEIMFVKLSPGVVVGPALLM